jgi:hypothetical protein
MSRKHLAVAVLLLALAPAARASDPTGIYAVVDKVILEPSTGSAERIQVWGVFALSQGKGGDEYSPPSRGYLYFTVVKGKEDVCRKEWADLKKLAGTKQCVAFGSRYERKGGIRQRTDPTKDPDRYPLGFGLTKVPADNEMAKKLLAVKPLEGKDKTRP